MKTCPRKIFLTQGRYTLVDAEDYEHLSQWKWHVSQGRVKRKDKGGVTVLMYRYLMAPPEGYVVDHINNDPLDNRRLNLRRCTNARNMMNKRKYAKNKSGYKGVSLEVSGRYVAQISVKGKTQRLGTFDTPKEAAKAYDAAALLHYREFASLNL